MEEFKEKLVSADPFKTWWPFIVSILVGLAITIRCCPCVITWITIVYLILFCAPPNYRNYSAGKKYLGKPNHRGRWFIVTGANGGIGREVCLELATRGNITI